MTKVAIQFKESMRAATLMMYLDTVIEQVPLFWQGFGKQASKCEINYHKSSFYRIQMKCEIPELLIQDIQNIINSCFTDITICMLYTREKTYWSCTSEVIKTTYQKCNICAKFARTVKKKHRKTTGQLGQA